MASVGKNYYENPRTLYFMGMFWKRVIIKIFSRSTGTSSPQSFPNHEASAHPCASRCLSIAILPSPHLYYGNGNWLTDSPMFWFLGQKVSDFLKAGVWLCICRHWSNCFCFSTWKHHLIWYRVRFLDIRNLPHLRFRMNNWTKGIAGAGKIQTRPAKSCSRMLDQPVCVNSFDTHDGLIIR